jgi:hypothetical protein
MNQSREGQQKRSSRVKGAGASIGGVGGWRQTVEETGIPGRRTLEFGKSRKENVEFKGLTWVPEGRVKYQQRRFLIHFSSPAFFLLVPSHNLFSSFALTFNRTGDGRGRMRMKR